MKFNDKEIDEMEILGDFILAKDDTDNLKDVFRGSDKTELARDNLRFFKVVKLPHNLKKIDWDGFVIELGDDVVSIAYGTSFTTESGEYRLFETKYITCKLRR